MSEARFDTVLVCKELSLGYATVTAADLLAAGGLLTVVVNDPTGGAFVHVEAGAVIKGVQFVGPDGVTDSTADYSTRARALLIACLPGAPGVVSVIHESGDVANVAHRLRVQSTTPDVTADGAITHNPVLLWWLPTLNRWAVPWSAP